MSAKERAAGLGYSAGWGLVKTMPSALTARAFRVAADVASVRNGKGTQQLRANLRRVVGSAMSELRMDALIGAALRSYARYWMETFRLESMDHAAVAANIVANSTGVEHIGKGLATGHGVVLALPHTGNWDASGVWLVSHSGPFTTVAERLKPASVFDRFVAYRESLGMEVIALTGSDRSPTSVLTERLKQNKVVCLLADRDLTRTGIEVDFFGGKATMPPGPAMLAATTGAALHVVNSFFVGDDGWRIDVHPRIELPGERLRDQVRAGTQTMADGFAAGIAKRPQDWHMLQRLWLED